MVTSRVNHQIGGSLVYQFHTLSDLFKGQDKALKK